MWDEKRWRRWGMRVEKCEDGEKIMGKKWGTQPSNNHMAFMSIVWRRKEVMCRKMWKQFIQIYLNVTSSCKIFLKWKFVYSFNPCIYWVDRIHIKVREIQMHVSWDTSVIRRCVVDVTSQGSDFMHNFPHQQLWCRRHSRITKKRDKCRLLRILTGQWKLITYMAHTYSMAEIIPTQEISGICAQFWSFYIVQTINVSLKAPKYKMGEFQ